MVVAFPLELEARAICGIAEAGVESNGGVYESMRLC